MNSRLYGPAEGVWGQGGRGSQGEGGGQATPGCGEAEGEIGEGVQGEGVDHPVRKGGQGLQGNGALEQGLYIQR